MNIDELQTPCLLLDRGRMLCNIARLKNHLSPLNGQLRPHVKTAKCSEIAELMLGTSIGPITVSTLKEAEQFAAAGYRDILYAVGLAPSKLDRVMALRQQGVDLIIILDTIEVAKSVVSACDKYKASIPVLIEIDSDGHRAGIRCDDPMLIEVARVLDDGGAELRGVMTHAGSAYNHPGAKALCNMAEQERAAVVAAAEQLNDKEFPCPVVSVGSSPTATFVESLSGVTEVRAGVFVFQDLVMAGLGVCDIDDIAISVLTTVIGRQKEKGWLLVDAGWMAMSRDRGTASQSVDQGYGLVCDQAGKPYPDLIMVDANQEHGILALRHGSQSTLPDLAIGSMVRILPNHACSTASQYNSYNVLDVDNKVMDQWQRFSGW
jgi:D-serine deaminase-like pyridoxal phosphate-dependent protein